MLRKEIHLDVVGTSRCHYGALQSFPVEIIKQGNGIVPSCCVIFDLDPLSLSFDFVFNPEIVKSFPVITSSIPIESRKSPTVVLLDDDTGRISIVAVKT
ncbi:hypothetical protein Tco_0990975 [Tanacetum coccineum]|uniref:Uncharacterized protein n=1 Tax=Tanacetum coccineum TaxID=301880 RepID=A0ABQ5EXY6_9ASTR